MYAHENFKIKREDDKRIKLTEEDKEAIRIEYTTTGIGQRPLAAKWEVSRRLIQFVISPEKLEKAKEQFKERQKDGRYYNTEIHREYTQKYRKRKKQLFKDGLLIEKKEIK